MSLALIASGSLPDDVDAVAFGVYDGVVPIGGRVLDEAAARRRGFTGALGETLVSSGAEGRLEVAVGLGDADGLDRESLRRAGAAAVRAAKKCTSLAFELGGLEVASLDAVALARAVGEGAVLAAYHFDRFKSEPSSPSLERMVLVGDEAGIASGIEQATAVTAGVELARDLINTPAGDLSPRDFAEIAREVAESSGLSITVYESEQIEDERLGGLLGVAAGSDEPPRFIRLVFDPKGTVPSATVALVGKGITFDSGGLSIKPANSMMTMKYDMSGAAAVLGAMSACRALGVAVRVIGYMPVTENMVNGSATKPGDVLTIRNGKTIEVLNTDAEGRLVLADALSLAVEDHVDAIIDLATLTGVCVAALGRQIAGLLGNDDRLLDAVEAAATRAGEPVWQLPVPGGYRSHIDSEIADMKNIGATGQAGALSAALLLKEFVASVPWAHLDIAGPAYSEEDKGYLRKGGTGFGIRTLLELLGSYEPFGGAVQGEAKGLKVLR